MNGIISLPLLATTGPSLSLPGPYWLFTILHWLTFALHLIAMNILVGGLIALLVSKSSPLRKELFTTFTRLFPVVMAATITLGVAPLLFLQVVYGEFFYSASIISGWNWFLLIPILLVTYYLLYAAAFMKKISDTRKLTLLVLAGIGFVYISYTFVMISDLAEKPFLWAGLYQGSAAGTSLNPHVDETIFRWLHIMAGALAVAGMAIQIFALHHKKVRDSRGLQRFGAKLYLMGVIKATVLGLIYIFTWDTDIIKAFLASPGLHAVLGGIALNIVAIILVYRALKSAHPALKVWTSAGLVFGGVLSMVIGRHTLRQIYLGNEFSAAALDINPQWGIFAVFLIVFLAGLVTLYWMLRKYFTAPQSI